MCEKEVCFTCDLRLRSFHSQEIRNIHNEELMGIRREEEMEMSDDDMEDSPESKDSDDSGILLSDWHTNVVNPKAQDGNRS